MGSQESDMRLHNYTTTTTEEDRKETAHFNTAEQVHCQSMLWEGAEEASQVMVRAGGERLCGGQGKESELSSEGSKNPWKGFKQRSQMHRLVL